jgi:hypothetical protein
VPNEGAAEVARSLPCGTDEPRPRRPYGRGQVTHAIPLSTDSVSAKNHTGALTHRGHKRRGGAGENP